MTVRRKYIRRLVNQILEEHEIEGTPVPVEKIAKRIGATVQLEPADDDLSGFLYRDFGNDKTVIGVNADHHPNRRRFTIAHECAHLLLHNFDEVHVDRIFAVKLRSQKSSEGTDLEEKEANLFAAELLMPKEFIEYDLEQIDDVDLVDERIIAEMAKDYGVSTQAMTFRLAYLGYLEL